MKKGYKKCPFCGEEIKEIAKKCRFCGEFLEGENDNNSKEEKSIVKNYGFWGRFFRKDLGLNKKWWHRLLMILFFIGLIGYPIKRTYDSIIDMKDFYRMEFVDKVENRLGDDITQLSSILNRGEHIDTSYGSFKIGDFTQYRTRYEDTDGNLVETDRYYKKLYCAKNWDVQKVNSLADRTNLRYLSMSDYRTGNPSAYQINTEIDEDRCVLEDTLNGKKFLNHQFQSLDTLYIVNQTAKAKRHGFRRWFGEHFLPFLGFMLIPGIILIIIYYKVVLYIIYGGYKKKTN